MKKSERQKPKPLVMGTMLRTFLIMQAVMLSAQGADFYFDVNGASPGSGVANGGSYAWSSAFWSTATDGTAATGTLPTRNTSYFSAGVDGAGSFTVTGATSETGSVVVQEGNVTLQSLTRIFNNGSVLRTLAGTSLTIQNSPDFYNNGVTFDTAADTTITIAGTSSGSRKALITKTGPGRVIFQGVNSGGSGGTLTIQNGEYRIQNSASVADGASVVNSGGTLSLANNIAPTRSLTLHGGGYISAGALRSVSGSNSWNGLLTLGSATRIHADSGASLTLNPAAGNSVTGAFPLTLGGLGTITVSKPISAVASLTKDGAGVAILAAPNPFTGPTTVSVGTLRFTEAAGVLATVGGSLAVNANVEVVNATTQTWSTSISGGTAGRLVKQGGGRLTLSGSQLFAGTVAIQSGTLALATGASVSSVTRFDVSANSTFDVSAVPGFSLVSGQTLSGVGNVTGPLATQAGSVLDLTLGTPLTVTGSLTIASGTAVRAPAALVNGTYPLIRTTGGTLTTMPSALSLVGFVSPTQVASLELNGAATELSLVVATNPNSSRALTWMGDGSGNFWDNANSSTWRSNGTPVVFTTSDTLTFDQNGSSNPTVNLTGTLVPTSVTVASNTDYTLTGAGSIAGPTSLSKSGTGNLILTGAHTFTGGTSLTGGTLELRATGALGTGPFTSTATLALAPPTSLTLGNTVSGSGALVVSGGNATVAGNNTAFTGPATVSSGTLTLGHVSALGTAGGATTVSPGATLDLAGLAVGAEPVVLAGGTLANTSATVASLAGPITVSSASTLATASELTLSGALGGNAALEISSGVLRINGNSVTNTGWVTVASGATLAGSGSLGGGLTVAGTLAPSTGVAGVATLTVQGDATFQPGSTTRLRIQKASGVVSSDRLVAGGMLTLGGTLSVTVSGQALAAGDTFTLFSADSFAGNFSAVQLPYLYGDLQWDRSTLATHGIVRVIALPAVSTQAQRREWLLTRLADDPGGVDGFAAAGGFFARGDIDAGRSYALSRSRSLLSNHRSGAVQVDLFYIWPAMDLAIRYGPFLDAETHANIREVVLTFNQYKDTTTSNLKTLSWVTRFLGGQLYGEAAFDAAVDGNGVSVTNDWRGSDPNARSTLLSHLDTVVSSGFGEIASRPYFWKNLLPILSLGQLAQDPVVRQRAAIAYEAGLAQNAGYWLRGHLAMPTSRSYPDMLEQHPSSGASMGMFWYHFGGELPALDSESALMTAVMKPSVSPLLELAASDRDTPFFSRSRSGGNFLQSYVERDYALFADGPVGPNSGQVYANGVVWTDSDRSRYSHLWVAKPIHDDPSSINISNTHGKESRQFSETIARDALLYSFDIAPPADLTITPTPTPYGMGYVPGGYHAVVNDAAATGQIFLHYGSVLIAIRSELPFGWNPASGITYPSGTVRAGDSEFLIDGDTATTRPPATFTTPLTANLRFAVAIETARPADFPGATPADQLAAFRTAILAIPKPFRPSDAPTTAVYTTRRGDQLRLTKTQDASTYPVTVNGAPVEYALFPRIENPWIYQPAGSNTLILRSADRRETLDFSTWSRTVATGSIDVTPPVLANVPANFTIAPAHPQPTVTYAATASDDVEGSVPVVFTPPSGSAFTPGTTRIVTATATDSSLNYTRATFTVTVLPYPTPPAPAAPWSVRNIGAQPLVSGSAQHDVANRVFIVSGTGGTSGGGANGDIWSGTSEGFTYASRAWTGDGVFTARVWSLNASDSGAKAGIMVRESNTTGARNAITYMSASGSAFFQTKSATNGNVASSTTSGRGIPEWVRLVRSGNTFTGFFSHDGILWTQQGAATTISMSGPDLTAGLAVAPRTGGQIASVIFDNVTFHTPLDAWRLAAFGTDLNAGSAADTADFDFDGATNLMEYALGTTPTHVASAAAPIAVILNQRLQLTFLRARPDVTYIVETSSGLSPDSWTTLATNPGSVGQSVTVIDTVNVSTANPPRRFLRLRVTSP
jgi:autotransporter-associated beta strand protein